MWCKDGHTWVFRWTPTRAFYFCPTCGVVATETEEKGINP